MNRRFYMIYVDLHKEYTGLMHLTHSRIINTLNILKPYSSTPWPRNGWPFYLYLSPEELLLLNLKIQIYETVDVHDRLTNDYLIHTNLDENQLATTIYDNGCFDLTPIIDNQ